MPLDLTHVDPAIVAAYLVSVVIPGVTSLLGRAHWDGFRLGLITVALSFANGVLSTLAAAGNGLPWKEALSTALASYLVATLARVGLWKNTRVDSQLLAVGSKTNGSNAPPPAT